MLRLLKNVRFGFSLLVPQDYESREPEQPNVFAFQMGARDAEGTATIDWAGGAVAYVLIGMLFALLQEFAIAPRIVARQNVQLWHSVGTALYAVQWLCALVAVWRLGRDS